MKKFFEELHGVLSYFGFLDIGMLKVCLASIGVLLGVYFFEFFDRFVVAVWVLFILSWLYIVVKVFGVYIHRD